MNNNHATRKVIRKKRMSMCSKLIRKFAHSNSEHNHSFDNPIITNILLVSAALVLFMLTIFYSHTQLSNKRLTSIKDLMRQPAPFLYEHLFAKCLK